MSSKIKKLYQDGKLIYPATIMEAVKQATAGENKGLTLAEIIGHPKQTVDGTEQEPTGIYKELELISSAVDGIDDQLNLGETGIIYQIGSLSNLETTAKGSLVSALNELKNKFGGYAPLEGGKIPSSYMPGSVDDLEEYINKASFPATGESDKIYIDKATNLIYRWSGSQYTEISPSLALGETASTAFAGNRGVALESRVGSLANLMTANKGSIVDAINDALLGNGLPRETGKTASGLGINGSLTFTVGAQSTLKVDVSKVLVSQPITLKKGQTITVTCNHSADSGVQGAGAGIFKVDSTFEAGKTITCVAKVGIQNNLGTYIDYTATEDCQVVHASSVKFAAEDYVIWLKTWKESVNTLTQSVNALGQDIDGLDERIETLEGARISTTEIDSTEYEEVW